MRSLLPFFVLLFALDGLSTAQGDARPFPRVDSYTKDDPRAKTRAGYASFGPFRFGDDQTTDQIQKTLDGVPLIWVETEHFKIGSGLPEYALGDDATEKEHLQVELERLAKRLPDVKTKVRKLDPWLRLHLYAQRMEELYARFLSVFDITESAFPTVPPDPKKDTGPYMGEGRYLGMPAKFAVLIFDTKESFQRYANIYAGGAKAPVRWHFRSIDAWLYLTAADFLEGEYDNDSALFCEVVTGVSQCLVQGFRGARVPVPFPIGEGIAHWFSREIDPRYHLFTGLDLTKVRLREDWDWGPSVHARVEHRVFPSTSDMLGWKDTDGLEWADHLILWSRMDYLLARGDGSAGKLLRLLKEPLEPKAPALGPEELAQRARDAIQTVTGGDLAHFDNDWSEWVLRTYPKK